MITIEEQAARDADHIVRNQAELYQFFMDNLDSFEAVTQVITTNYDNPCKMGFCIKQQIDFDALQECASKLKMEAEDNE